MHGFHEHYDEKYDILYLRKETECECYGVETDDGIVLYREVDSDRLVKLIVMNYRQHFRCLEDLFSYLEEMATDLDKSHF